MHYKLIRKMLGQPVACHTHFGIFHGVIVHCTKHHVILMRQTRAEDWNAIPAEFHAYPSQEHRPFGIPPYGGGPGTPPGWGGGGWHFAIPLAAIIGIAAVGMHW
ncbi:hypothetical protein [Alicyclobacillus tolerans]|uniref:Uncharacterized protein n=1 Tax=Alicyclobacillus tolerans TaxID=90970 RepID=A0A1M6NQA5_9BACL|nr:hypothetical protein [Alicyclobacillus montanus]SHJ97889.1 hypothetical protein SAMN05443507_106126 [Alicyclobacillus montanus]